MDLRAAFADCEPVADYSDITRLGKGCRPGLRLRQLGSDNNFRLRDRPLTVGALIWLPV